MGTGPASTHEELQVIRDTTLARIVGRLQRDDRVVAVWLTGSFGRDEADAWSDYDLHVAIEDDEFEIWWAERKELFDSIAPVVFVQADKPSNAQAGANFQLVYFSGPVEVDWNVGPVSQATMPITSKVLFARRDIPLTPTPKLDDVERRQELQRAVDFFWTMTPIAVKYCGRATTTEAADQIDLMLRGLTRAWWLLHNSDNFFSPNPRLEPELVTLLARQGPTIDPVTCLDQIEKLTSAMTGLRSELEVVGVTWPTLLVGDEELIVGIARDVLERKPTDATLDGETRTPRLR